MNDYKNNYNVRDEKGRFVAKTAVQQAISIPAYNHSGTPDLVSAIIDKELLLDKLRSNVYQAEFEDAYGNIRTRNLTLMASYLTGYVGKGTSKSAPSNKVFAYDVDAKHFIGFQIEKVIKIEVAAF